MSSLGFKTRVDPTHAFFVSCMQWILQIHLLASWQPASGGEASSHIYKARSHCDGEDILILVVMPLPSQLDIEPIDDDVVAIAITTDIHVNTSIETNVTHS